MHRSSLRPSLLPLLAAAALVLPRPGIAGPTPSPATPETSGENGLRSIGALEVGPHGVLFVADPEGAAVHAYQLPTVEEKRDRQARIDDLDVQLAGLLGVPPREVLVQDMVVDPGADRVFVSVQRGGGDDAAPALFQVDGSGEIDLVELDELPSTRLQLDDAPTAEDKLYSWEARSFTITDLEYVDGELLIAGLSNLEFSSVLRRAKFPFEGEARATELEIYHGAHGEWETFAPIFSFVPYELDGKPHLLAGYLCTPLVTFPLEDLRTEKRLRGKTIAEIGWGNLVTDIVPYEIDGEEYVLVVNNTRGTVRFAADAIRAAQRRPGITEPAEIRSGVDYHTVPIGPVLQLADLDSENVLILGRSLDNGALYLAPRPKERL